MMLSKIRQHNGIHIGNPKFFLASGNKNIHFYGHNETDLAYTNHSQLQQTFNPILHYLNTKANHRLSNQPYKGKYVIANIEIITYWHALKRSSSCLFKFHKQRLMHTDLPRNHLEPQGERYTKMKETNQKPHTQFTNTVTDQNHDNYFQIATYLSY